MMPESKSVIKVMFDPKFAIEAEVDGVRKLYGPINTLSEAKTLAASIGSNEQPVKMRVHYLFDPASDPKDVTPLHVHDITPPHIHPDQTTVSEQIKDAEDYIDPATVD